MKKRDIISILIIGEIVAVFLILVLRNLGYFFNWIWFSLIILPILALIALALAYLISKKIKFVFQFAKFVAVGFANTAVDFGVLNILMLISGVIGGLTYSIFKGISFMTATAHSFIWNKFWTFERAETKKTGKEALQFFVVSLVGLVINVVVASLVVNTIGPRWDISLKLWANIGAACGSVSGLLWNFLGYKFIVFKK